MKNIVSIDETVNLESIAPVKKNKSTSRILNRMKYLASTGLVLLTTTLYSQNSRPTLYFGNDSFGIRPIIQLDAFGLNFGKPFSEINNFPVEYRTVPIHPDDNWIQESSNGPIRDGIDAVGVGSAYFLGNNITGGLVVKYHDLELEADVSITTGWNDAGALQFGEGNFNERDYEKKPGSSERGYGTALTYYSITTTASNPNFDVALSMPVDDDSKRIVVGASRKLYDMNIARGWDRFDSRQTWSTTYLSKLVEKSVYTGLLVQTPIDKTTYPDFITAKIVAGCNFYSLDNSKSKYSSTTITGTGTWFVEMSLGFRF